MKRSQEAWSTVVDRYGRLVYSIPRRYRIPDADAEDIVQQVFTLLFRRLPQLRDCSRLSAWLITTTQRECWRHIRQNHTESESIVALDPVDSRTPEEQAHHWEQQHLVRVALEHLGEPCEELLTQLFLVQPELSYEEIGRKLNMPVGSIGPTRARCFSKLEAILIEMGFEPER